MIFAIVPTSAIPSAIAIAKISPGGSSYSSGNVDAYASLGSTKLRFELKKSHISPGIFLCRAQSKIARKGVKYS